MRSVPNGGNNIGRRAGNDSDHRASNDIDRCPGNDNEYRYSNDDDDNDSVAGNDVGYGINGDVRKRRHGVYDKRRDFHRGGRGEFPPSDRYEGYYLELLQPGRCPH
jgi:hypothetical protein